MSPGVGRHVPLIWKTSLRTSMYQLKLKMNVMVMNLGLIWLVLLIRPPEHRDSKTSPTVYPQKTL